jgi:hypothetical protein
MEQRFKEYPILTILNDYFSGQKDKMVIYLQKRGEEDALWRATTYNSHELKVEINDERGGMEKAREIAEERLEREAKQEHLREGDEWADWEHPHALMGYLIENDMWEEGDDVYKLYHFEYSSDKMPQFQYMDKKWGVGTDDDLKALAIEYVKSAIGDFAHDFLSRYIDGEQMAADWEDGEREAIWGSPDSYLDDDDRDLSEEQEQEIEEKREQISALEEEQNNLNVDIPEEEQRYEEITDEISTLEDEISDIENSPEGDWKEEKLEEKLEERMQEIKDDPLDFLKGLGMDDYQYWKQYVDEDEAAEEAVDEDGVGRYLNGYDGSMNKYKYNDTWYATLLLHKD